MHTEAQIVLEDVLVACNSVHLFGNHMATSLEGRRMIDLSDQEKDELNRAFLLLHETIDCVHTLINFHNPDLRRAWPASTV